ncbi:hypothetical protein G3T14_14285 [Methylobacterium sp. BTF04]|uniref:hypothetical protein n=1 Tax=Methylobacterium sp. BTF04 TaxID=2708300 RepID=UPI0013D0A0D2|nr:hypothetical protein [Methylobacterium sp. BTF04]NEU13290.1 hypothetical protein [Methylobacterium sp. BTF04]
MAEIKIVAGNCGKGRGLYDAGVLTTPDGVERSIETLVTVEAHGDVAGARNWGGQVLNGLKGSLALASNIDLSGTAMLAATALATVSSDDPHPQTLLELTFQDGALLIGLADLRLPALIANDREVLRRGFARASQRIGEAITPLSGDETPTTITATGVVQSATDAVQTMAGTAGASLSSAFGFVRRTAGYERG